MGASDFLEHFSKGGQEAGAWDAVLTQFFIDTAANVIEYLECIWEMLRPGGVWINLGPLLYHWACHPSPSSPPPLPPLPLPPPSQPPFARAPSMPVAEDPCPTALSLLHAHILSISRSLALSGHHSMCRRQCARAHSLARLFWAHARPNFSPGAGRHR